MSSSKKNIEYYSLVQSNIFPKNIKLCKINQSKTHENIYVMATLLHLVMRLVAVICKVFYVLSLLCFVDSFPTILDNQPVIDALKKIESRGKSTSISRFDFSP